jgi:ArsR family transcriptional regulator, arsenate/arsenite/antimonite-responsive transcriptional repressor
VDDREFIAIARALSDPTRVEILSQIRRSGSVRCTGLCGGCGVSQPTVSHHVAVLREAGLIRVTRRGTLRVLTPNEGVLRAFARRVSPGRARASAK